MADDQRVEMSGLGGSIPRAGHRSYWLQDVAGDDADRPSLVGDRSCDVAIVGGGYTGLWSAIEIKDRDPSVDVVLLEADICGSGASGRNGGFAMTYWSKIALLLPFLGRDEALRLATASVEGIDDMREILRDHGLDCDFHQGGWLWTATHPSQLGAWDSTLDACRSLGVTPFEVLDPTEVAARTGSATHVGGVFDRATARVHPAKLARGLRAIALAKGVTICEHSPVIALDYGPPASLETPTGKLVADRVVLAHNVWAAGMPTFRRTIAAISSDMIVTAPVPERLAEIGWTGGEVISDSQLTVHYYQATPDGRVAFGQGGGSVAYGGRIDPSFDRSRMRAQEVTESFRRLYPNLADVPIEQDWAGAIDRSLTGLPLIGHTDGRRHIVHAVGWSANAVGPARLGGKFMASLALETDDEWSRSPLVNLPAQRFPPEPVRFLGAKVVRRGVVRKERAQLAGRRPGLVSNFLAAQVPSGMIPKD